jgi:O-antigen ligase
VLSHTSPVRRFIVMSVGFGLITVVAFRVWSQSTPGSDVAYQRLLELGNITGAGTFLDRLDTWRTVWPLLLSNPFGIGFWGPSASYALNPHNMWLWLLQGTGVIGVIGFLMMIVALLPGIWRGLWDTDTRRRTLSVSALGVLGVVFVAGLASAFFQQPAHTTSFWVVMGSVAALDLKGRGVDDRRESFP